VVLFKNSNVHLRNFQRFLSTTPNIRNINVKESTHRRSRERVRARG